MRKLILPLLAVMLLGGCATNFLKSDEPAPVIFSLRAANTEMPQPQIKTVSKVLEVQRPSLPPGFDTARIAMYLEDGRRLDYYAGAKWAAPLDETLQEFTSQTARRALSNVIIASPGQSIDIDYRLKLKVNDFEPIYRNGPNEPPLLLASITFTLLALPNDIILTSFTVEQQMTASSNNLGVIADGLQGLLQSIEAKAFETIAARIIK